ncbi:hypothetical protein MPTK1_1g00550 [Marchantia polymorpha subsp. ruderalis]|uniref:Plastid lipid-associated protein/fibrillin conserved domain-containing protein n=2 Tax=Marchantia polymorpha TaxID=3197 RepID=A0AAF6AJZ7_MARPO|nr:hypothetical protein MARPO_0103s0032 [Marchantia polymorpha]BBM96767.1 hypothetical protein Mp_1g00550 [Marchantia polymorpha subsp. ruderalis]|eukprot:PTQ32061.1 hypothetical protein MARPO_0103s0032 [Marchantia polymorpha]
MHALKLPTFVELQSGVSISKSPLRASGNSALACSTGSEFYARRNFRLQLEKSSFIRTYAKFRAPISVSRLREPESPVTRALAKDDSSKRLDFRNSLATSDDQELGSSENDEKYAVGQHVKSKLCAIGLSMLFLYAPELVYTNIAEASQLERLGQIRQAGQIFERAVEGLSKIRFDGEAGVQVLDKALTVVTGSTIVDPEVLDQKVEAFIRGETDIPEELRKTVTETLQGSWSNLIDVVTNFNPGAWSESAGASIQTFLEAGLERFAAFEISALVTLGERWLILTPLVVLPMAWQMKRNKDKSDERAREDQIKSDEISAEAQVRGERVKRELERIELRMLLLDAVNSLGEMALQPPRIRGESGLIRRRIQEILERLQALNPVNDTLLLIPEVASSISASSDPNEPMAYIAPTPTIDGDWRLIYVSETGDNGGDQELPQLPGIALDNIRQRVWQSSSMRSAVVNDLTSPLSARNTAEVRFGPFGVLEIAVQGVWENLADGQMALVSFDTFSARPLEVFGNKILNDLPQFDIAIPRSLQQRAEWGVLYVDNHIRINRGRRGQLFLFSRAD